MREITKTISSHVDGKPADFRLTKLDAFNFRFSYLRFIESAVSLRGGKLIVSALNAVILFVCCSAVNS